MTELLPMKRENCKTVSNSKIYQIKGNFFLLSLLFLCSSHFFLLPFYTLCWWSFILNVRWTKIVSTIPELTNDHVNSLDTLMNHWRGPDLSRNPTSPAPHSVRRLKCFSSFLRPHHYIAMLCLCPPNLVSYWRTNLVSVAPRLVGTRKSSHCKLSSGFGKREQ